MKTRNHKKIDVVKCPYNAFHKATQYFILTEIKPRPQANAGRRRTYGKKKVLPAIRTRAWSNTRHWVPVLQILKTTIHTFILRQTEGTLPTFRGGMFHNSGVRWRHSTGYFLFFLTTKIIRIVRTSRTGHKKK